MSESTHQHFDSLAAYREALAALIGKASHRLWFYEQTLEESELGSRTMHDLLWQFILRAPAASIRILVRDPDYLVNHCPRLMQLRERFSHLIEIRSPHEEAPMLESGFVLADEDAYLKRVHFDWMRGEVGEDGRESAILEHQFDELWEHSAPPAEMSRLSL